MKKTLLSLVCLGALAGGLNAQRVEFQYSFWEEGSYRLHYRNYNNADSLVFGGGIRYDRYTSDYNTKVNNIILDGLVGKNLYLKQDGNSIFGVNLLGGLTYWRLHREIPEYSVNNDAFAPRVLLNLSGIYNQNIIYDIDLSYESYFGDYKGHIVEYSFGVGYKFTDNFYAKANVNFSTMGEKEKSEPTSTKLGFTLGYEF